MTKKKKKKQVQRRLKQKNLNLQTVMSLSPSLIFALCPFLPVPPLFQSLTDKQNAVVNRVLGDLRSELRALHTEGTLDPFNLYL